MNSIHYNSGLNPRWINYYIDNTRHVEITLKKEQMDLLEKYLRSWLEFGRYAAKIPELEEKRLTSMSNNILELIICSKMHKIGDYELVHLPANLHSRAQQQLEKQEQDGLVFRPDIDELEALSCMLYGIYSCKETMKIEIGEPRFGTNTIEKKIIGYILGIIEREIKDWKHYSCFEITAAETYQDQAHVIFSKEWIGEYVMAIDINSSPDWQRGDPCYEGSPDSIKIFNFVEEFEDKAHLVLPKEWAGKMVFMRRIGN